MKRPQPPRKVYAGNHAYKVTVDKSGIVGDHAENRGSTQNETLSIVLDGRLARSHLRQTLLHEVLHAVWDQTALTATDVQDDQELVVQALAPVLLDVLCRNPSLVEFLLDADAEDS